MYDRVCTGMSAMARSFKVKNKVVLSLLADKWP